MNASVCPLLSRFRPPAAFTALYRLVSPPQPNGTSVTLHPHVKDIAQAVFANIGQTQKK